MVDNGNIHSLNSSQTNRVQSMEQKKYKAAATENLESLPQSDKATVSVEAHVLAKSVAALNNVDDVRHEKVAMIKEKIESGTYEIRYQNVASRIETILNQISD